MATPLSARPRRKALVTATWLTLLDPASRLEPPPSVLATKLQYVANSPHGIIGKAILCEEDTHLTRVLQL